MSTSAAFDRVAGRLGEWTQLDALAARGTVRLMLKEAGLEVASVSPSQMAAAARHLLPGALRSRGWAPGFSGWPAAAARSGRSR